MDELYITTAHIRIAEEELQKYPYAGGLFRLQTDVQGMETFNFRDMEGDEGQEGTSYFCGANRTFSERYLKQ